MKEEKRQRKDPGEREKEKGEDKERRNFGAHNWRQYVGWLNRGVEGSESPCTPMEKKVQVRPRLTRLCFTAHPSSLLPSFSLPSSVFFFPFFFSMLLLLSILPPFFSPVAGILLRTLPPWCTSRIALGQHKNAAIRVNVRDIRWTLCRCVRAIKRARISVHSYMGAGT